MCRLASRQSELTIAVTVALAIFLICDPLPPSANHLTHIGRSYLSYWFFIWDVVPSLYELVISPPDRLIRDPDGDVTFYLPNDEVVRPFDFLGSGRYIARFYKYSVVFADPDRTHHFKAIIYVPDLNDTPPTKILRESFSSNTHAHVQEPEKYAFALFIASDFFYAMTQLSRASAKFLSETRDGLSKLLDFIENHPPASADGAAIAFLLITRARYLL